MQSFRHEFSIKDEYFSDTTTAIDSSASEVTPPESPLSLADDYVGTAEKEADQKLTTNFSLPLRQDNYFNKQDTRLTLSNPQFNSGNESSRATDCDFNRNCRVDSVSIPEDCKQIGKFIKEKLSTSAGAVTLEGFIKFIQEGDGVSARLCQGIDQLVVKMGAKGIQINSNANIFHLSWNKQQNAWSAKTEIPFTMFLIEDPERGGATGHYSAEILYKENSSGMPIIKLTAQFSALEGLEKLNLPEAEFSTQMKYALDRYKRPSTLAASLSGFLARSASSTKNPITPLSPSPGLR